MKNTLFISRKITASVADGVQRLRSKSFVERDVKLLIMDLREYARHTGRAFRSEKGSSGELIREFLDVADFIAHPNRNQGILEDRIRSHMQILREELKLAQVHLADVPYDNVINVHRMAGGLLVFAGLILNAEPQVFAEILENQSEIVLCMMSILQDSFIVLKDEEGHGVLQLRPYDGKYRIYCRVFSSKLSQEIRALTEGGKGPSMFAFPVMVGEAACIDEAVLNRDHEALDQPVFETYRDQEYKLRVREVK